MFESISEYREDEPSRFWSIVAAVALLALLGLGYVFLGGGDTSRAVSVPAQSVDDKQDGEIADLQDDVAAIQEQLGGMTTTTVPPNPVLNTDPACQAIKDEQSRVFAAYGVPEGLAFKGQCGDDGTGLAPVYAGAPDDVWTLELRGAEPSYLYGYADVPVLATGGTLPTGKHHPAYPDALAIEDMKPGTEVCMKLGSTETKTYVLSSTSGDSTTSLYVRMFEDGSPARAAWSAIFSVDFLPLDDAGVIPYQDGTWSINHLVGGACAIG